MIGGKLHGNILLTGGTGTLGKAIAARCRAEEYDCTLTCLSRDPVRQQEMRRQYPEHRYVLGDVCDPLLLAHVAYGHDLVIHAAAQKHIPQAEANPAQCYAVNVQGSANVLEAARAAGVPQVLAISTDKACHPVNVYGASKFTMERLYQHFAHSRAGKGTRVNLCRYGNVIGSTGSVVPVWRAALERGERPKVTDPAMTRFWLTAQQAVDLILFALAEPTGSITIPLLPALTMGDLLAAVCGPHAEPEVIGLRPGEKLHEELLTAEEAPYAQTVPGEQYVRLYPVTGQQHEPEPALAAGYTSDIAPPLGDARLAEMLK